MKEAVYQALKEFEQRLHETLPAATFRFIDSFEGHDVAVEVFLPGTIVTREARMKLAEVAADMEEKYEVYIGILTHPEAA
ncbi:MAG: hypothetical protein ACRERD_19395 [Candidatus Binatia bacterium]